MLTGITRFGQSNITSPAVSQASLLALDYHHRRRSGRSYFFAMKPSSSWTVPTRRELILVFGLLVVLLFVSQNDGLVLSPESVKLDEVTGKEGNGVQSSFSDNSLRDPRLSWGETPPETTLVAHAAGV